MRTRLLRLGAVLVCLAAPARPVWADNDWLGIEVPQPMDQGTFDLNEKVVQTERQLWEDGGSLYYLSPPGGGANVQDLITLDTRLDWKMSPRLALEADVPTVFSEFSPYTPGIVQIYNVNTPGVQEGQGLGDIRLGLRGALRPAGPGFNAGWNLAVVAPTGLGPFEASQPLAATGAGRWQVLPGLVVGGRSGPWEGWLQATGRLQVGRQAVSSPQTFLDWRGVLVNGQVVSNGVALPAGGVWLGPRYGGDAVSGLAWIWYQDSRSRMGLAVEGKAHWLSPWTTASGSVGVPAEEYFVLTPELQARYGRYSALVGWQAVYLWAVEEPLAPYGEVMIDVAYTF